MEKGKVKIDIKTLLPVMLLAIYQTSNTAFTPILATLSEVFPDASVTTIQLVLTITSSMSIPASFLTGILATYMPKKKIALGAAGLIMIGGLFPIIAHTSVYHLIISSLCIGLGQGFMITVLSAMIAEMYEGNARASAMGFRMVAANIGRTVLILVVGYLARGTWYNAYYIYLLVIPIIILAIMVVPMGEKEQKIVGKGVGLAGIKNLTKLSYLILVVIMFCVAAVMFTFYTNIAMTVQQLGLGDSTVAAQITSANTLIIMGVGLVFGFIIRVFKKYTFVVAMVLMAISFIGISMSTSVMGLLLGGILFGVGAGMLQVCTIYFVSEAVPKEAMTLGLAISMAATSLGISVSPVIINPLKTMFFGVEATSANAFFVAAILAIVLAVSELLRNIFLEKDSKIGQKIETTEAK
ncbi:MAG: MFS transporter [Eubacteriales bacterium]